MKNKPFISTNLQRNTKEPKQVGFTLLWVAVLILGVSATAALALLKQQTNSAHENMHSRAQVLQAATEAISGYAAIHGRLPCPATTANGAEQCSSGLSKGWLPLATLATNSGSENVRALYSQAINWPIRYIVYRNGSNGLDLTKYESSYGPRKIGYDPESPQDSDRYIFSHANINDLCNKLQLASPLTVRTAGDGTAPAQAYTDIWQTSVTGKNNASDKLAYVTTVGPGSSRLNIAFGLAVVGPASEAGINASNKPEIEWPGRQAGTAYSDITKVIDFRQLARELGCTTTLASLDTAAIFTEIADSVEQLKKNNHESARDTAESAETGAKLATIGILNSIVGMEGATFQMILNIAGLVYH